MKLRFFPGGSYHSIDGRVWLATINGQGSISIGKVRGLARTLYKLANPQSKRQWKNWWGEE